MEIRLYNDIINEMNELGIVNGINIDDYLSLSNELLNNLEEILQIDINRLYRNRNIKNYDIILTQIKIYKKNEEYIRNINEYYKNLQKELSYTLQYQRNKKLKMQLNKKKSIYSNK